MAGKVAHTLSDSAIRQRLQAMVKHLEHVLPGQAPIKDFVHHNTLHGYQHLHFTEALEGACETTGTYGYLSQDEFVELYREGRINRQDLLAVIREHDELLPDQIWWENDATTLKREQIIFAVLLYGNKTVSASKLSWLIEEKNMLTSFMPYVPQGSRKKLLATGQGESQVVNQLWKASLDVLGLSHDLLHPEEIADLTTEFAELLLHDSAATPADSGTASHMDQLVLHGAMRRKSDHIRAALWQGIGKEYTLRGLLKRLTGHDILDDYRPVLLRHLGSFLDQGVASWHQPDREKGFFAAWKQSAYADMVRFDPELPDWQDELDSLPDDPLEVVMWELDHLGLDEAQWADYLQRLALELPGWSGMFLWLHEHPGYEGMRQPVNMMDYLAVRMVLERLYAQRLTRRKWQLEASLYSIQWYFRRRRSELFVRYCLFNENLPEFLVSRAQRLASHDTRFADRYDAWQKLADMIWLWQQSDYGGLANHNGSEGKSYTVYDHAWKLFRLMQILGVPAEQVRQLSDKQISEFFALLDSLDRQKTGYLWLQTYERHYRETFFHAVSQNVHRGNWQERDTASGKIPEAQIFFCMDDREEGIRRHLEAINPNIETLGAAAHFNVPHRWRGLDDEACVKLTPVTIDPVHEVHEVVAENDKQIFPKHRKRQRQSVLLDNILHHEIRRHLLSGTLLMIASAPATLLILAGKVFAPLATGQLLAKLRRRLIPPANTEIHITVKQAKANATPESPSLGYSVQEQAERVADFLRTNGLTSGFSPLVVIMGHGSTNQNNPHRSAYGCGACSGKFSGPNGRVLARMANNPEVRALLAQQGLLVPDTCWFMGAMHNTCSEQIDWYDTHLLPEHLHDAFARLQEDVLQASLYSAHERCRKFASAPLLTDTSDAQMQQSIKHIIGRSVDFSQARPELGHATNACAIIGRRAVSQGVFFDRRLFLISYDARVDDEQGSLLEALLLSAGPVGARISLEYYFSKVSNDRYGAGSKITHNVTGFFGVMEGAGSDLRTGLPKQMIEIHEPMRLQVMVEATTEILTAIYERAPTLQELIGNEWILLSSVDPDTGAIHYFDPRKGFIPWSNDTLPDMQTVSTSAHWYTGKMEPLPPVFVAQEGA